MARAPAAPAAAPVVAPAAPAVSTAPPAVPRRTSLFADSSDEDVDDGFFSQSAAKKAAPQIPAAPVAAPELEPAAVAPLPPAAAASLSMPTAAPPPAASVSTSPAVKLPPPPTQAGGLFDDSDREEDVAPVQAPRNPLLGGVRVMPSPPVAVVPVVAAATEPAAAAAMAQQPVAETLSAEPPVRPVLPAPPAAAPLYQDDDESDWSGEDEAPREAPQNSFKPPIGGVRILPIPPMGAAAAAAPVEESPARPHAPSAEDVAAARAMAEEAEAAIAAAQATAAPEPTRPHAPSTEDVAEARALAAAAEARWSAATRLTATGEGLGAAEARRKRGW